MEKDFLASFTGIIRDQIVSKNEVHISGLGLFKYEHVKQFQEQKTNGRVIMVPPKDVIRFFPEKNTGG